MYLNLYNRCVRMFISVYMYIQVKYSYRLSRGERFLRMIRILLDTINFNLLYSLHLSNYTHGFERYYYYYY